MKKKTSLFIPGLFLFVLPLWAVESSISRLEKQLQNTATPPGKVEVLKSLMIEYMGVKPAKSIAYGKEALDILRESPHDEKKAELLNTMCWAYVMLGNYTSAMLYANQAENLCRRIGNQRHLAIALSFTSRIYTEVYAWPQALEYAKKAHRLFEELGNRHDIAGSYIFLGGVYMELKYYKTALSQFQLSVEIYKKTGDKTNSIATAWIKIGDILKALKKYPEALNYYSQALEINEKIDNKTDIALIIAHKSQVFSEMGQYPEAIRDKHQALKLFEEIGNIKDSLRVLVDLGRDYRKIKKYSPALNSIARSLETAKKLDFKDVSRDCYEELANIYEAKGDHRSALQNHRLFKALNDDIFNEKNIFRFAEYEAEKVKKNEEEIELLNFKIVRQKIVQHYLIIISVLILIIALVTYNRFRIGRNTARILGESELRLKQINAAKDRLFTIIAHDLGSPLNSLLLSSGHLQKNYDILKENDIKEFIRNIFNQTTDLTQLLENLLQWAMAQIGKIEQNPEAVELKTLVQEIIQESKHAAEKKNIDIAMQIKENSKAWVDRHMIKAVLRNLVSNAVKFSYPGGLVNITSKELDPWVELTVSDHGMGIAKEKAEKLFVMEIQESTRGTANEKGTGLGLLLCKEFVEKNGGEIHVHSQLKRGSAFSLILPMTPL